MLIFKEKVKEKKHNNNAARKHKKNDFSSI